jgi:hypothetical protein
MCRVMRNTRAVSRNELPACSRFARHAHVLQRDLAVLDDLEGNFVDSTLKPASSCSRR